MLCNLNSPPSMRASWYSICPHSHPENWLQFIQLFTSCRARCQQSCRCIDLGCSEGSESSWDHLQGPGLLTQTPDVSDGAGALKESTVTSLAGVWNTLCLSDWRVLSTIFKDTVCMWGIVCTWETAYTCLELKSQLRFHCWVVGGQIFSTEVPTVKAEFNPILWAEKWQEKIQILQKISACNTEEAR